MLEACPLMDDISWTQYQLTADDFIVSNQLNQSPTRQKLFLRSLIWSLLFSTVFFITVQDPRTVFLAFLISLPAGLAAAYALDHFLQGIVVPWQARRLFKNYPLAHLTTRIFFASEALHAQNKDGHVVYRWSDFIRWRMDEKVILTYCAPNRFIIIPTRLAELGFPIENLKAALVRALGPPR